MTQPLVTTESSPVLETVIRLIRGATIDLSSEKRAQDDVEQLFIRARIDFEREFPLGPDGIVDFLAGGVAIELKLKGARKKEVFRQLSRYAKHPAVTTLVLASNLSMGLPARIEGKDTYFVRLGEGWL